MAERASHVEIPLDFPVKLGEQEICFLNLRRPLGKDFRLLKQADGPFAMILSFAAHLADVPEAVIDRLEAEDVSTVVEVVGGFLGKSPATGLT